jgi:MFS family permease
LFFADVSIVFGEAIGLFCIEVLIYQMTGSKLLMGTIAFVYTITEFVFRFLGTPIMDRFPKTQLMTIINTVRALTFFVVAFLLGWCSAWFLPSLLALIPSLLEKESLVRGYSLLETFGGIARLVGPFCAASLVNWSGAGAGLGLFAIMVTLSGICIFLITKSSSSVPSPDAAVQIRSYWKTLRLDLMEGFRIYQQVPALMIIISMLAISNFGASMWSMLLVPFGIEALKVSLTQISFLNMSLPLGIMAGSLLNTWLGERPLRSRMILISFFSGSACIILIALTQSYPMALLLFFGFGFSIPLFNAYSSAIHAQLIPESHQGRVTTIRLLIGQSLLPIGSFVGGWIAQNLGFATLYFFAGVLPLIAAIGALFTNKLKQVDGNLDPLRNQILTSIQLPVKQKQIQ